MDIFLGKETNDAQTEIKLPKETFLRHAVCLGSSGSGKTVACKVICEEFLLAKVPIIAIDPQGDIASMILAGDAEQVAKKGLDPAIAQRFHQQVEVVIWTPGSYVGVPICLDPLRLEGLPQRKSERVRVLSAIAANLTALLGYSLDSNDGQFASAYLDLALQYLAENNLRVDDLSGFAAFLDDLPESLQEEASRVIKESKREELGRKIQVLGIGARKLLFQVGAPIDIDVLLGTKNPPLSYTHTTPDHKKTTEIPTRLSVIYLNTLHSQEEKEFFISQITQGLYDWMLNNPASTPQALFYIDEIAPFIPPVRKPACKDILKMLFKQARKYGISCLIASQNPGDIDYTALAQFSTWALGRMMIRQDIKKVEKIIRSLSPADVDTIVERLPSLNPGEFLLLSPDVFERVVPLNIRWLYTQHETLEEDRVEELISDEMRERLARHADPDKQNKPYQKPITPLKTPKKPKEKPQNNQKTKEKPEKKKIETSQEDGQPQTNKELLLIHLNDHPGAYSVKEVTHEVALSETLVRRSLKELVNEEKVATAKIGRRHFYWLQGQRFEPSVGIVRPILALSFHIKPEQALVVANAACDSSLFGLLKKETVEEPEERYLLLWRVNITFQKTSGMLFKTKEQKETTLYFHAQTGRLLIADQKQPIKLVQSTEFSPDALLDIAAKSELIPHTPAELKLASRTLKACKSPEAITDRCRELFFSKARHPQLVAMPYWKCKLRESNTKSRTIHVDGLFGHIFEIPKK